MSLFIIMESELIISNKFNHRKLNYMLQLDLVKDGMNYIHPYCDSDNL